MNKTYRTIWNEALGAWVATSELGGGRRKGAQRAAVAVAAVLLTVGAVQAQVKFGDNPNTINPGSVIEAESTNRGVLITRVALTDRATWTLNGNQPVEGMVVYNTNATTGANGLQAGMAVWKGGQWVSVDETPYLHVNSTVTGNSTLANSGATGANSVAVGPSAVAAGVSSVAIGDGALVESKQANAIAIGRGAQVLNYVSTGAKTPAIAIGYNAIAHDSSETIVGSMAGYGATLDTTDKSYASDSAMFGSHAGNNATYKYATFIGQEAGRNSNGLHNTAIGQNAMRNTVGGYNTALGSNALAITAGSSLSVVGNAAIGTFTGSGANGNYNTWTGYFAGGNAKGNYNVATGSGAGGSVTGDNNIASGTTAGAAVTGSDNVAIGNFAGFGVSASRSISMGSNAQASKDDTIAIGSNSIASGVSSISVGTGNTVSGNKSGAFGDPTTITGTGSYSVGNDNTIDANNAFVLGNNVTIASGLDGAVGIGNDSTVAASTVASYNPGTGTVAGTATGSNVVSVGASGAERRVTNVAAGGADTDAVNVSQLKAVNAAVEAIDFPVRSSNGKPYTTTATGTNAFAAGATAVAQGDNNTAVGEGAVAGGSAAVLDRSTALGSQAKAPSAGMTSLGAFAGYDATNSGASTYVGTSAGHGRDGSENVAVGANALVQGVGTGNSALGIGAGGTAQGDNNVMVGRNAGLALTGDENVVVGAMAGSLMTASRAVVLGADATSTVDGGVALGSGSLANRASGSQGYVPANASTAQAAAINATTSTLSAVSVGNSDTGATRQIAGVAAGTDDSDAVNVSQLKALDATVAANKTKYFSVNSTGGTNEDNLGATGADAIAIGKNASAPSTDSVVMGRGAKSSNANDGSGAVVIGADAFTGGGYGSIPGGASGFSTVTVGQKAEATGSGAVAVGDSARANAASVAVGVGAVAGPTTAPGLGTNFSQIAIGAGARAGADLTSALGVTGAIAIGQNAQASPGTTRVFNTLALGNNTVASGTASAALGNAAIATAERSVALGDASVASVQAGIAGYVPPSAGAAQVTAINATTSTAGAVSVGDSANGIYRQITSVAAGTADSDAVNVSQLKALDATVAANKTKYYSVNSTGGTNEDNLGAAGVDSIASGKNASVAASSTNAVAMGLGATVQADSGSSIAIGDSAVAKGLGSVALGKGAQALGSATVANGYQDGAVAIGNGATVSNSLGVAIGSGSTASGYSSTAVGVGSQAAGTQAVATGYQSTASSINASAYGANSLALGIGSAAFGVSARALGNNSSALGNQATASGLNSTAVGAAASASGARSAAVGILSRANFDNDVALGSNSTTAAAVGTANTTILGTTYNFAGTTPASTVSVGSVGVERTITNVAAGRISATSTDAINGSQLNATNSAIQDVSTVAGKGWNLSANGEATPQNIAPGGTADFAEGDNIEITRNGSTITVATAKDVNFDSVTTGTTVMNNAGITVGPNVSLGTTGLVIVNGPSVTTTGIDAGGKVITNVAAGVAPTDAVNVSQLTQSSNTAANKWITGSPTTYTAPVSTGTDSTAVGSGASVNANNSVAVGTGASATTDNSVALGNGSTTSAAVATTGATIAGSNYSFAGSNPTGVVSVGSAGNERQIQNVAAGQLNAGSTDAVNGSQLYATNQAISTLNTSVVANKTHYYSVNDGGVQGANYNNDGASGVNAVASGVGASASGLAGVAVGLNATATSSGGVAIGAGALADRTGMNGTREAFSNVAVASTQGAVSVGSAGGERQITNVAGGTAATDAVNVRQLTAVQQGAVNYATNPDGSVNYNQVTLGNGQASGGTTISNVAPGVAGTDAANVDQLNAGVAGANQYTDQKFNQTRADIDKVGKRASAGTAGAMAMANLPQAYLPGKSMLSVGVAGYDGESALALGVSKLSDNGRWVVKFSGTGNSRGKFGVGAGAGFHW